MASAFSFLIVSFTPNSLFRHWTWALCLAVIFSTLPCGPSSVAAEPKLLLRSAPNFYVSNLTFDRPAFILPVEEPSHSDDIFAAIPLPEIPNVQESTSILAISSRNDSNFTSFILQIENSQTLKHRSKAEVIIFAFLGVTFTNLCAITGVICIPIRRLKHFNRIISFMMALAVGSLSSAAILVLLPEAIQMQEMPRNLGGQGRAYLLKLSCVPAGLLFLFFIEYFLIILPRLLKGNDHSSTLSENATVSTVKIDDNVISNAHDLVPPDANTDSLKRDGCCSKLCLKNFSNIALMAWTILLGDSVHNFMDGMAIAVGFMESPTVGVTICLSILFEELPHELGDFAVFITSGLSIKCALCANFLSACFAYLGLIVGLIIGEISSGALYVFAITAGVFLYISISEMLPSIRRDLEEADRKHGSSWKLFLLQVAGLVTGFACVLGVILGSDHINL